MSLAELDDKECFQLLNPPFQFGGGVRALLSQSLDFSGQDSQAHVLEESHGMLLQAFKQESTTVECLPRALSIPSDLINQTEHQIFFELIS